MIWREKEAGSLFLSEGDQIFVTLCDQVGCGISPFHCGVTYWVHDFFTTEGAVRHRGISLVL